MLAIDASIAEYGTDWQVNPGVKQALVRVKVVPLISDPASIGLQRSIISVVASGTDEEQIRELEKSSWFSDVVKAVVQIASLPDGWNGHGAGPVQLQAISAGVAQLWELLQSASRPPATYPRADGGINFEWSTPLFALTLAVDGQGQAEVSYEDDDFDWAGLPREMPDVVNAAFVSLAATDQA
jgi:hypothetical protein